MPKSNLKTTIPPASSHLKKILYDTSTRKLTVTFDPVAGRQPVKYQYSSVSPAIYAKLADAEHPGTVLAQSVIERGNTGKRVR